MHDERTAYHESGHCIAARTLGLPIKFATIDGRPHLLRGAFSGQRSTSIESIVLVCLAGPAAEQLFFGRVDNGGDAVDIDLAHDYLRDFYAAAEIGYQLTRMRLGAERLVTSSHRQIMLVADALMRHGSLSGEHIVELLNGSTVSASWVR
jgi:hypothetical protein